MGPALPHFKGPVSPSLPLTSLQNSFLCLGTACEGHLTLLLRLLAVFFTQRNTAKARCLSLSVLLHQVSVLQPLPKEQTQSGLRPMCRPQERIRDLEVYRVAAFSSWFLGLKGVMLLSMRLLPRHARFGAVRTFIRFLPSAPSIISSTCA
jgi:hypothetical protein